VTRLGVQKVHRLVRQKVAEALKNLFRVLYLDPNDFVSSHGPTRRATLALVRDQQALIVDLSGTDPFSAANFRLVSQVQGALERAEREGRLVLRLSAQLSKDYLVTLSGAAAAAGPLSSLFQHTVHLVVNGGRELASVAAALSKLEPSAGSGIVLKLGFAACSTSVFVSTESGAASAVSAAAWLAGAATRFGRKVAFLQRVVPHNVEVRVFVVNGIVRAIVGTTAGEAPQIDRSITWYGERELLKSKLVIKAQLRFIRDTAIGRVCSELKASPGLEEIEREPWLRFDFFVRTLGAREDPGPTFGVVFNEFEMGNATLGDSSSRELVATQLSLIDDLATVIVARAETFASL